MVFMKTFLLKDFPPGFIFLGTFLIFSGTWGGEASGKFQKGLQDSQGGESPQLFLPSPREGEPVLVAIEGVFQGPISYQGAPEGSPVRSGSRNIPLEEVLFVHFAPQPESPQGAFLLLKTGDEFFSTITGGDEREIRLRSPCARPAGKAGGDDPASSEFHVSLESLRGIGFPRHFPQSTDALDAVRRWFGRQSMPRRDSTEPEAPEDLLAVDRILLTEGAELTGVLLKVNAEAVHFQSKTAGDVEIPLSKVQALLIAELAMGKANQATPEKREGEITTVVQCQEGSLFQGELISISGKPPSSKPLPADAPSESQGRPGGQLLLRNRALGTLIFPLERILRLSFLGGRCQYLSDLEPVKVTHRKDFFTNWEIQRDLSATGDPMQIRGITFRKGLGMHSHCRADFELKKQYTRFQSVIGMDDRARPSTPEQRKVGAGIALFRIYLDGRLIFEKELSWTDPPLPVDLSIEGAETLSLELDHGPGFLVLDRGNWADARIIKKKAGN